MPFPRACDREIIDGDYCPPEERELCGCGHEGHEGKGDESIQITEGTTIYARTCPQYCLSLPIVDEVIADLEDYKRGALGNVDDMEHKRLIYLRVAEQAYEACKRQQEKAMYDDKG